MTPTFLAAAVAIAFLAGVAVWLIMPALAARLTGTATRAEHDLAVYRDQLAEIERDRERGTIQEAEATAARSEVERRMLRVADMGVDPRESRSARPFPALAAILIAMAVPAGAIALYAKLGSPETPDVPVQSRLDGRAGTDVALGPPGRPGAMTGVTDGGGGPADAEEAAAPFRDAITQLQARLEREPEDFQGWVMLARSYRAIGESDNSAQAFARAIKIAGDDAPVGLLADHAEAVINASEGIVTPTARKSLDRALEKAPSNPKARYYAAVQAAQSGALVDAVAIWRGIEVDSPPDAPWLESVHNRIEAVSREGGFSPGSVPPRIVGPVRLSDVVEPNSPAALEAAGREPAPPAVAPGLTGSIADRGGPSQTDMQAVGSMSGGDRQAFIRSMVAKLADRMEQNPDDANGWMRLGRAYMVLGERDDAETAFGKAETVLKHQLDGLAPDAPEAASIRTTLAALAAAREAPATSPPPPASAAPPRAPPVTAPPAAPAPGLTGSIADRGGPAQADMQAVGNMSSEDRQAFIRSMVAKLADRMERNPDDANGWMRLGRAYTVLGEREDADEAFGKAEAILTSELEALSPDAPEREGIRATLEALQATRSAGG